MYEKMMSQLRIRWVYLTGFLLAGLFVGTLGSIAVPPFAATAAAVPAIKREASSGSGSLSTAEVASPSLAPREVVLLQLHALRDSAQDPSQIIRCYLLASPSNRTVTGPLERFAYIVLQPPFTDLSSSQHWQVGEPVIEGRFASVLVTTCTATGAVAGFRFELIKQVESPYSDCWMTEAVTPLTLVDFEGRALNDQDRKGLPRE